MDDNNTHSQVDSELCASNIATAPEVDDLKRHSCSCVLCLNVYRRRGDVVAC